MGKLGKVFMLDDDLIILNLYKGLLENMGYQVFATSNAYQFLLYAKEMLPDVFILDLNMPEVSGWEILHRLKGESKLEHIPVVILSVAADQDLAIEKGVAHYIKKPTDTKDLIEIVECYTVGNKKHDVLLLDDYRPLLPSLKEKLAEHKWSCFEVNDLRGAKAYLKKNSPKVVVVSLPQDRYEEVVVELDHDRIFYLKGYEYIEDIGSFMV